MTSMRDMIAIDLYEKYIGYLHNNFGVNVVSSKRPMCNSDIGKILSKYFNYMNPWTLKENIITWWTVHDWYYGKLHNLNCLVYPKIVLTTSFNAF
jgi:hypothetical protein